MSLESKIEKLTKAIETLTVVMSASAVTVSDTSTPEVVKTETTKPEVVKTETTTPEPTHADLKAACLKVARNGKKEQVKDLLAEYGAVKAVDISVDALAEVINKLEAL